MASLYLADRDFSRRNLRIRVQLLRQVFDVVFVVLGVVLRVLVVGIHLIDLPLRLVNSSSLSSTAFSASSICFATLRSGKSSASGVGLQHRGVRFHRLRRFVQLVHFVLQLFVLRRGRGHLRHVAFNFRLLRHDFILSVNRFNFVVNTQLTLQLGFRRRFRLNRVQLGFREQLFLFRDANLFSISSTLFCASSIATRSSTCCFSSLTSQLFLDLVAIVLIHSSLCLANIFGANLRMMEATFGLTACATPKQRRMYPIIIIIIIIINGFFRFE